MGSGSEEWRREKAGWKVGGADRWNGWARGARRAGRNRTRSMRCMLLENVKWEGFELEIGGDRGGLVAGVGVVRSRNFWECRALKRNGTPGWWKSHLSTPLALHVINY